MSELDQQLREMSPLDRFIWWISERWQILQKKTVGLPKPWSQSKVMQSTYFTNVRREDDKVTKWYSENIREPLKDKPEVIFATIVFRWFNWPTTGSLLLCNDPPPPQPSNECGLLGQWHLDSALHILTAFKNSRGQVFTGAFNISNSGSTKPKINRVCEDYIQPVWEDRHNLYKFFEGEGKIKLQGITLEKAHKFLSKYPGLGGSGFMAAQVIADLKYTDYLNEKEVQDWWTWSSPGPGSRKGLNIVLGKKPEAPNLHYQQWQYEINRLRDVVAFRLPKLPRLHAQDLQNTLCEMAKFERVLEGGRSKRKYNGN